MLKPGLENFEYYFASVWNEWNCNDGIYLMFAMPHIVLKVEHVLFKSHNNSINKHCCCCWVSSVVSDSVRPHRGQPTSLPCPWDSPGKKLEWVAIFFSNLWKWKVKVKSLSCFRLLVNPWTAAHQAPPSMGFSRQEYWNGGAIAFSD